MMRTSHNGKSWACAAASVALIVSACAREQADAWPDAARVAQAVELDHVYIWVQPGAPEVATLRDLGFHVDTTPTHHTGNGTSSKSVLFENGYLELLYLDSTVTDSALTSAERSSNGDRARWRQSGANPFGLGLRRRAGTADSLPFPSVPLYQSWMKPGTELRQITTLDQRDEPDVFVVPRDMALPAWIDEVRADDQMRQLLQHPLGTLELTSVQLHLVAPERLGPGVRALAKANVVEVAGGTATVATLTFNRGRRGVERDLRPTLPLVIHY